MRTRQSMRGKRGCRRRDSFIGCLVGMRMGVMRVRVRMTVMKILRNFR